MPPQNWITNQVYTNISSPRHFSLKTSVFIGISEVTSYSKLVTNSSLLITFQSLFNHFDYLICTKTSSFNNSFCLGNSLFLLWKQIGNSMVYSKLARIWPKYESFLIEKWRAKTTRHYIYELTKPLITNRLTIKVTRWRVKAGLLKSAFSARKYRTVISASPTRNLRASKP